MIAYSRIQNSSLQAPLERFLQILQMTCIEKYFVIVKRFNNAIHLEKVHIGGYE